ncbi:hypothetical protein TIFTF001_021189, partial [Ficus carica]
MGMGMGKHFLALSCSIAIPTYEPKLRRTELRDLVSGEQISARRLELVVEDQAEEEEERNGQREERGRGEVF